MRFFIHTLGCKINQYETQAIREAWLSQGLSLAASPDQAQLILVHTCAVTAKAAAESRGAVARLTREVPLAKVLVSGCAARTEPEAFKACPGKLEIVTRIEEIAGLEPRQGEKNTWPDLSISSFHRARPIIKIQDGCSHGCSYCVVPKARGPAMSRPYAMILAEVRGLLAAGRRELVISGINLGQFVLDRPKGGLWDLLARLEHDLTPEWSGRSRLRLSSLDPGLLNTQALDFLSHSAMICRHLHISLQSADPSVLKAMGRGHYHPENILNFLEKLVQAWPIFALGFDLLTGFPGESAQAHGATLDFCRRVPLSHGHVFPYSRRPGTAAAKARDQLDPRVKKNRARQLRELVWEKNNDFLARLARQPLVAVAVEELEPPSGLCEYYADCRLENPADTARGQLLLARPLAVCGRELLVEAI